MLTFLTPAAALFALAAVVPLAVHVRRERRAGAVRRGLGLPRPPARTRLPLLAALVALPGLAALAAAQPVLELTEERRERADAEGWIVIDTSRSMLAAAGPDATTRFDRARALAAELRAALPEVPLGLATFTDRTLPYLFPTTDRAVFGSALRDSMAIEQPPPRFFFAERATELDALAAVVDRNYFAPTVEKRLLVVLTDGESREFPHRLVGELQRPPGVELLLVPTWSAREQVYAAGVPEPGYEADPRGPETLARVAADVGGRLVEEGSARSVGAAAAELVGTGPTRVVAREGRAIVLMPYAAGLAAFPLALLLRRRNL